MPKTSKLPFYPLFDRLWDALHVKLEEMIKAESAKEVSEGWSNCRETRDRLESLARGKRELRLFIERELGR